MIDHIRLKNYKSFEDIVIPIKQLTVLLGANNTGKSAVINALLMLKQTANECDEAYKSALKINGMVVSLGKAENLCYMQKDKTRFEIEIGISNYDTKAYELIWEGVQNRFWSIIALSKQKYDIHRNKMTRREIKESFEFLRNANKDNKETMITVFFPEIKERMDILNEEVFDSIADIFEELIEPNNSLKLHFFFACEDSEKIQLKRCVVTLAGKTIIDYSKESLSSDYTSFSEEDATIIDKVFNGNVPVFYCFDNVESLEKKREFNFKTFYLIKVLKKTLSIFKNEFADNSVNYTMPLRDIPSRLYVLDKAKRADMLDCFGGSDVVNVLKNNKSVKDDVNKWLSHFNINVDVNEVADFYYRIDVKEGNISLNIPDVGFGISQILPIITQGFALKKNMLMLIEQPEIHLHPKMQADIADLLISIQKDNRGGRKRFLVETHSEYLLRRLKRRIGEGKINHDDVAICSFQKDKESNIVSVKEYEVSSNGAFPWPEDFMDDDLWKDNIA